MDNWTWLRLQNTINYAREERIKEIRLRREKRKFQEQASKKIQKSTETNPYDIYRPLEATP